MKHLHKGATSISCSSVAHVLGISHSKRVRVYHFSTDYEAVLFPGGNMMANAQGVQRA